MSDVQRREFQQQTARLLDVKGAALYLSVSAWTVRDFVAEGELQPVELPSRRRPGERLRRLLFDRADLDALIERRRQTVRAKESKPDQQGESRLPKAPRSQPRGRVLTEGSDGQE